MLAGLLAAVFSVFGTLSPADRQALEQCGVDADALGTYLSMDQEEFDQDLDGGWRAVSFREGCGAGAAVLIQTYILYSRPAPPDRTRILRWHAGQVLAGAGEEHYPRALAFFEGTYDEGPGEAGSDWDQYVDATIAFLEGDRERLIAARARLEMMAPSEEAQAARRRFLEDNPDMTMPDGFVDQPQNMAVVEGLVACFGRAYADAYGADCRQSN